MGLLTDQRAYKGEEKKAFKQTENPAYKPGFSIMGDSPQRTLIPNLEVCPIPNKKTLSPPPILKECWCSFPVFSYESIYLKRFVGQSVCLSVHYILFVSWGKNNLFVRERKHLFMLEAVVAMMMLRYGREILVQSVTICYKALK